MLFLQNQIFGFFTIFKNFFLKNILIFAVFGTPIDQISAYPMAAGNRLQFLESVPHYEKNSRFYLKSSTPFKTNDFIKSQFEKRSVTTSKITYLKKEWVIFSYLESFSFKE